MTTTASGPRVSSSAHEPSGPGRAALRCARVPSAVLVASGAGASGALATVMLLRHGRDEAGLRKALRATGRCSQVLFCAAFSASALHRLAPSSATRTLLRRRRQVGLAMAASHTVHLLAILRLFHLRRGGPSPVVPAVLVGGSLGYALLAAMAATSNDPAVRWLGARRWKRLHTVGGWYLLGVFGFDAVNGYLNKGRNAKVYAPLAALLAGTAATRRLAAIRSRTGEVTP